MFVKRVNEAHTAEENQEQLMGAVLNFLMTQSRTLLELVFTIALALYKN